MTTTTQFGPLGTGWNASHRITIAAATEIAIGNPSRTWAGRFVVTQSTSIPGIDPGQADMILPGMRAGMSLVSGDYLWLAGDDPRMVLNVMAQAT